MWYIKTEETEEEKMTGTEPQNVSILLLDLGVVDFLSLWVALSMLNIKILKMPSGYATY